jgi:hypothetical protein
MPKDKVKKENKNKKVKKEQKHIKKPTHKDTHTKK